MKILICTDSFYPGIGGTEAACLGYATELSRQGHSVLLACPNYHQKDDREYPFDVLRLPSFSISKNDKAVLLKLSNKKLKQLHDFKPDIIHCETVSGMAKAGLLLGKKLNVPVVMTVHTQFEDAFLRSVRSKFIVRKMLKNVANKLNKANGVITVSKTIVPEIQSWGYHGEIMVIKNGAMYSKQDVSDNEKSLARKNLNIEKDDNILIFVGRMVKYKNVEFLLRAFHLACEKGFKGKLLLVGDGIDSEYFSRLNIKLERKNADNVLFTGQFETKEKIMDTYIASDLFVTASVFDTDPIVVVEAACMGVPSLVIENTGCSNRVENGVSGFTCSNDINSFADKIIEIFNNKEKLKEIGEKARDFIPNSWQETVNENLKVYKRLLNK